MINKDTDYIGEKKALENTKLIIGQIPTGHLNKSLYKKLVRTIYDKQLKKWTNYSRHERHRRLKNLQFGTNRGGTEVADHSPAPTKSAVRKGLNKKQGENIAGQGSQQYVKQ